MSYYSKYSENFLIPVLFSISTTRRQTPRTEPEDIALLLAATHFPDQEDTILGHNEYNQVAAAVIVLILPDHILHSCGVDPFEENYQTWFVLLECYVNMSEKSWNLRYDIV